MTMKIFYPSQSLSILVPEKKEQMEQRKKAMIRRSLPNPPTFTTKIPSTKVCSSAEKSTRSSQKQQARRPQHQSEAAAPPVILSLPAIGKPTTEIQSRWEDSSELPTTTKDAPKQQSSRRKLANNPRQGRFIPNPGSPRRPVKTDSLDGSDEAPPRTNKDQQKRISRKLSPRKGRIVPNRGPPRLPVKKRSVDRAP